MKKVWAVALLLPVAVSVGCSGGGKAAQTSAAAKPVAATPSAPPYLSVFGDVSIVGPYSGSQSGTVGEQCAGLGVFADVHEGTNITLADSDGTLVGATQLTAPTLLDNASPATRKCEFSFTFNNAIVKGQVFTIEVAGHGKQSLQRSDAGSSIHLTLGSQS